MNKEKQEAIYIAIDNTLPYEQRVNAYYTLIAECEERIKKVQQLMAGYRNDINRLHGEREDEKINEKIKEELRKLQDKGVSVQQLTQAFQAKQAVEKLKG